MSFKMRRGLSIALVLVFLLGPLSAALEGSEESRLPACCRRHGAHHCMMSEQTARMMSGSGPAFSPPAHCPLFPEYRAVTMAPAHALAASVASLPAPLAQAHTPSAARAAALVTQVRTRAGRGPPASLPA
jgi:hypothetical protein